MPKEILARSNNQCELCSAASPLTVYTLAPAEANNKDSKLALCQKCTKQIDKEEPLDELHWRCLENTMWSDIAAIQVATWRLLNRLSNHSWAAEKLDMMYLDDETLAFAKLSGDHENTDEDSFHRDCNGQLLNGGDSVVLIKSLDVKGSTLNAKQGTVVKNIRLVPENTEQIEGKIEGQTIVILTKYVRKQG